MRVVVDCANGSAVPGRRTILEGTGATVDARSASRTASTSTLTAARPRRSALAQHRRGHARRPRLRTRRRRRPLRRRRRARRGGRRRSAHRHHRPRPTRPKRTPQGIVVASVLSNGGLEKALIDAGGRLARTPVGDKYILDGMMVMDAGAGRREERPRHHSRPRQRRRRLVTALEILSILARTGRPLSELARPIPLFPQQQRTIHVRHKDQWEADPTFAQAVEEARRSLAGGGRILVRPSGTEPALRIMVEGEERCVRCGAADSLSALAERATKLARSTAARRARAAGRDRAHMCGIVGYIGPREAAPILLEGLARLEYRGYDSAGIALVTTNGDMFVEKRAGKLANLRTALLEAGTPSAVVGLAHTRWATHGRPERPERASPPGLHGRDHGHPQRHHRELQGAARRAPRARPRARVRHGHGGARAPRRRGLRTATSPMPFARALRQAHGAYASRGHALARAGSAHRRAHERAAHRRHRARARTSWRPMSPRCWRTRSGSSSSTRATSPTSPPRASRSQASTARRANASSRRSTGRSRAAEKGGYPHFMLKEMHEQPAALLAAITGRVHDGRRSSWTSSSRSPNDSRTSNASSSWPVARPTTRVPSAPTLPGLAAHSRALEHRLGVPLLAAAARRDRRSSWP